MKANKKKLPTVEELRFAAKAMASQIAKNCGIDPGDVRHLIDTHYNKPCFVVIEDDNHAVVVYDDDPGTKFCIFNRVGRLQPDQQKVSKE